MVLMLFCNNTVRANNEILVIHSWHDILWDRLWELGLSEKLGDQYQLTRMDIDAMRLSDEQRTKRVEEIWKYYLKLQPGLVILGDDVALKEFGWRLENLTPTVYLGINHNPRKYFTDGLIPENITGVIERPLYRRAVHLLVDLLPAGSKRLMLINDSPVELGSVTDINEIFRGSTSVRVENIDIDLHIATSWEQWQETVLNAKNNGYDAILFDSRYLLRDASNRYVEPEPGVVRWMARNSPVPIFNFYEDSIGPGLSTGGWVVSGYEIGRIAADFVIQIMNGKKPGELPPYHFNHGEYIFSREQLEYWNIQLPDAIKENAKFAEDTHKLYVFSCEHYPDSICYQ